MASMYTKSTDIDIPFYEKKAEDFSRVNMREHKSIEAVTAICK